MSPVVPARVIANLAPLLREHEPESSTKINARIHLLVEIEDVQVVEVVDLGCNV